MYRDINQDIQLKIADFGVSTVLQDTIHAKTFAGISQISKFNSNPKKEHLSLWLLKLLVMENTLQKSTFGH